MNQILTQFTIYEANVNFTYRYLDNPVTFSNPLITQCNKLSD